MKRAGYVWLVLVICAGCGDRGPKRSPVPGSPAAVKTQAPAFRSKFEPPWEIKPDTGNEGRLFKQDFLRAIRAATLIELVEQSSDWDFDFPLSEPRPRPHFIYARVVLENKELDEFLAAAGNMDERTQDGYSPCVPEYHHALRFFSEDHLLGEIRICFQCTQIEWKGSRHANPWSFFDFVAAELEKRGLHVKRDWYGLARKTLRERPAHPKH